MPIVSGDLKLYLTGGAANDEPFLSLGGVTSSVLFINDEITNLFEDVTPAEAAAGSVKYRALAFKNTSVFTAYAASVFINLETVSPDTTIALAYDSVGTQSIVDEDTAPVGLSFSAPLSLATAIALGDVPASGQARIWFRRTVDASAAQYADEGSITITVGNAP